MAARKAGSSRDDLEKRVAQLERQLQTMRAHKSGSKPTGAADVYCSVPELPPREFGPNVSAERARLVVFGGKKWVNGTVLHYAFFEGSPWGAGNELKDLVRQGFDVWKDVGIGLRFEELSSLDDAEIRIGFQRGDGYWSYVGTDVLNIGQGERTMNFDPRLTQDSRGVDVPVHEIGHTMGFPHEHQNPFAGIVWDEEAVYDYFGGSPNFWPRERTFHNILRKIPPAQVEGSEWDPDSIMHYAFVAGLIVQPEEYQDGLAPAAGLSDRDREQVKMFYPPIGLSYPELRPFDLQQLSLSPGEQRDFSIRPTATREYTIQTFGSTDSVMVLFEDLDGDFQFVAGDDDSGWDRNARLRLRLYSGRKYVLRIRLFYQWASGETAVMLW